MEREPGQAEVHASTAVELPAGAARELYRWLARKDADMGKANITLVVLLFVPPDRHGEFEQFEASAARIMKRHGGSVERRIAFPHGNDASQPHELHIVTFPDREAFERYRGDPEIHALAGLRAQAIRDTVIWYGHDCPICFTKPDAG